MKTKISILLLISTIFLTSGFGCRYVSQEVKEKMKNVELNYWRVWDGPDVFNEIIAKYTQLHPFVKINYTKLRYEEFEEKLIEAFATDRAPDIFSIHNTWIKKYQDNRLITPMPEFITMAYPVERGTLKKEIIPELRTTKSITLKELKDKYFDVVYDDVVIKDKEKNQERIYGLPLFIDTLAMFYNRDLFNNAGITSPSEYWNRDFQQNVKKLTKQNNKGQIIQSGIALGGAYNIERNTDILSVLMMQNGTEMMEDGIVKFNQKLTGKDYNPGSDALRFYMDFANPAKEIYSWNKTLDNSIDMFVQNKLAMMFGYAYMLPDIRARAPKLNFGISKLPQIEGNSQIINFANYWTEVVSAKSKNADIAWDFVQFITREEQAKNYTQKTQKPTALRSLINGQLDDQNIGIFAEQVLTAKSWYKGHDSKATELIIQEMIDSVVSGQKEPEEAISFGVRKIQQTIKK
ncbi:hypothetical protein A2331_00280 [Candidatus Falkowbacteria bacterium RIFOXYB2_FULL_34_18]|uniref:ABC transporter substrate-binding protein n=1 Tax=Candidatus Falkowbacteria bacterium RIFOXYD2_FULL_34_120 TaxID=1798007 RepID=A0A1F5TPG5_9BACT|nr:MAG: hypothetical protein A2331_00280 [Candidatus Falkowbacteria bacterium RIFOXYB2_FULL_34_18]OGF29017.1 MAG: hypothetical protein A2500_02685 [Candidatus Falkowbacteria bacterium RIFOXYC12_FULL_34_55]OGF35966.1 MAG: hypothetical protein A2466_01640 [Candidatus Falkowbacteria bacterium RIFOXYC2_FULL_34_220]OGF38512.1 MAG: hypothetical protein A2515_07165 [Candidatus Falkowbacteria bacterium RIFOXYD12_FULL_34_57]OGF40674.1 MAG: hypothetical protein A2531_03385 [Candidatus Falkowbacteria bact